MKRVALAFDKEFASIFGLTDGKHLPTVPTPDPLSDDEASEGICALPELTEAQMAEGDLTAERR
jgi:hypothetical protein